VTGPRGWFTVSDYLGMSLSSFVVLLLSGNETAKWCDVGAASHEASVT
jgi:hypothetical protein